MERPPIFDGREFNRVQRNSNEDWYGRDSDRGRDREINSRFSSDERGRKPTSRSNDSANNMEWASTYERDEVVGDGTDQFGRDVRYEKGYHADDSHYDRESHGKDERSKRGRDSHRDDDDDAFDRVKSSDRDRYKEDEHRRETGRRKEWDTRGRETDWEVEQELERARYGDRRDRERDRDRDVDRSRSGDRDRSWDRDREKERDRGRDRDRRRDDRNERDRDYESSRERRRSSYDRDEMDRGRGVQSAHIMVRGLPSILTREDELAAELKLLGLEYQDIKIVKNRLGESRGFGFVDFFDVPTAEKWMRLSKGSVTIGDHKLLLEYSRTKSLPNAPQQHDVDWYCSKCRTLNYASRKRTACFSCGENRKDLSPEDEDYEGGEAKDSSKDPMSAPPCNVLMMRGLDTNSSEETIRNSISELTSLPIFDVRLIKDKITGISRGFCFIEVGSVEDATVLMKKIQESDPAYFIDGKRVSVGYAKNTPYPPPGKAKPGADIRPRIGQKAINSSGNSNIASVAIAQAHAAQLQGQSADLTFQQQQQPYDQPNQYAQGAPASHQATDASQAPQNSQATQVTQAQPEGPVQQKPLTQQQHQLKAFPGYTYDAATGYYYDANTGLYYDANTGYYYNGNSGKFLHWDAQQQQYFSVNADGTLSSMESEGNALPASNSAEKVKSKPSGSNARKIAKDMERWAKKTNETKLAKSKAIRQAQLMQQELEAKEEALRKQIQSEILTAVGAPVTPPDVKKATTKSLFAAEDDDNNQTLAALLAAKTGEGKAALASSLVAEYGEDSDEEQSNDKEKFIDWNKMACLLCKRQFPNKDILTKHTQMSDLHKQNLALYKQKTSI